MEAKTLRKNISEIRRLVNEIARMRLMATEKREYRESLIRSGKLEDDAVLSDVARTTTVIEMLPNAILQFEQGRDALRAEQFEMWSQFSGPFQEDVTAKRDQLIEQIVKKNEKLWKGDTARARLAARQIPKVKELTQLIEDIVVAGLRMQSTRDGPPEDIAADILDQFESYKAADWSA